MHAIVGNNLNYLSCEHDWTGRKTKVDKNKDSVFVLPLYFVNKKKKKENEERYVWSAYWFGFAALSGYFELIMNLNFLKLADKRIPVS